MYYTLHCARFQPFRSSGTPCQSCQSSLRLQSWCAEPLYFPVIWQWSRTLTSFSTYCFPHIWLISKHFLLILAHSHWLIKFTLDYFPAIFFLLQHLLRKFFNGILYSVNLHWFWIFVIIAAHDFVTITTSCTLLTFVCIWFGIFWMASLYFFRNESKSEYITKGTDFDTYLGKQAFAHQIFEHLISLNKSPSLSLTASLDFCSCLKGSLVKTKLISYDWSKPLKSLSNCVNWATLLLLGGGTGDGV